MDWFRSYHGAPTDPKLGIIAQKTGVSRPVVIAVWWQLLDQASQAAPRGSVTHCNADETAFAIGADEADVNAIFQALKARGLITPDGRLAAWDKRQPKREDNSGERVKRFREKKKSASNETPADPSDDDGNADVTHCNAVTLLDRGEREIEEIDRKKERKKKTPLPPAAGDTTAGSPKGAPSSRPARPPASVPDEYRDQWAHVIADAGRSLEAAEVSTYLLPLVPVAIHDGTVSIQAPSRFLADQVRSRYGGVLSAACASHFDGARYELVAPQTRVHANVASFVEAAAKSARQV